MWERLLTMVQAQGVQLGMTFLDSTNIRARHKAAGAAQEATELDVLRVRHLIDLVAAPVRGAAIPPGDRLQPDETKACVITDGSGRAITFLAADQTHELPQAAGLLARRYASHAFHERIWNLGARPVIPPQRHEALVACPSWVDNN